MQPATSAGPGARLGSFHRPRWACSSAPQARRRPRPSTARSPARARASLERPRDPAGSRTDPRANDQRRSVGLWSGLWRDQDDGPRDGAGGRDSPADGGQDRVGVERVDVGLRRRGAQIAGALRVEVRLGDQGGDTERDSEEHAGTRRRVQDEGRRRPRAPGKRCFTRRRGGTHGLGRRCARRRGGRGRGNGGERQRDRLASPSVRITSISAVARPGCRAATWCIPGSTGRSPSRRTGDTGCASTVTSRPVTSVVGRSTWMRSFAMRGCAASRAACACFFASPAAEQLVGRQGLVEDALWEELRPRDDLAELNVALRERHDDRRRVDDCLRSRQSVDRAGAISARGHLDAVGRQEARGRPVFVHSILGAAPRTWRRSRGARRRGPTT